MDLKELRKKEMSVLQTELAHQREELREMRFSVSNKQLKNLRVIRVVKKDIARILTVIKELIKK
ncbi:MAG: 50S ribosomal protein L29 [Candidatus Komeilibacteria bacterium CG_4_10_14_0_2_um_filter_37_10]|uniref:Large ribosomal subunit protein uL29 n=1 Tax=Candidatus Komeilibacteria bacterium CG_4_10_14_0_2_um_filter_37_10 TaxID=1974470 RepID=A0A2M7VEC2_9BACT|nr:MAG: 50S ribosomal protein L29 [Candidatus Komeilibacteria bacterium CG_4_10_14_0_2_um_filter_37_10]PJA94390.1 MAG: 50S ribosomal protein L29 [Candidatus Komeilibacteria bacterium CG_4_9_14_3_um_filter_37_5]